MHEVKAYVCVQMFYLHNYCVDFIEILCMEAGVVHPTFWFVLVSYNPCFAWSPN